MVGSPSYDLQAKDCDLKLVVFFVSPVLKRIASDDLHLNSPEMHLLCVQYTTCVFPSAQKRECTAASLYSAMILLFGKDFSEANIGPYSLLRTKSSLYPS